MSELMEPVVNRARQSTEGVLVNQFRIQITGVDVQRIVGINWLNDNVINFYCQMIARRFRTGDWPMVYSFDTMFYADLVEGGLQVDSP